MKIKLKGIANVKSFLNIFSGKDKTQQQHTEYFAQRSGKGTKKAAENSRKRFRTSKPKRQQKHSNSDGGRDPWVEDKAVKSLL